MAATEVECRAGLSVLQAEQTGQVGDKPSRPPGAWGSSKPRLVLAGLGKAGRICSGLGYVESIFMEAPSQSWRTWHPEGPG